MPLTRSERANSCLCLHFNQHFVHISSLILRPQPYLHVQTHLGGSKGVELAVEVCDVATRPNSRAQAGAGEGEGAGAVCGGRSFSARKGGCAKAAGEWCEEWTILELSRTCHLGVLGSRIARQARLVERSTPHQASDDRASRRVDVIKCLNLLPICTVWM